MKLKICLLGLLCLFFQAKSQTKLTNKYLQIGDKVPDITITNIINYPAKTAKISDFKGKLLIIDFWATWCSPCVGMIPKMEALQKQFNDKLQFLPVTYQSNGDILAYLSKREKKYGKSNLPDVVADTSLSKLFPHTYLPHYVWINSNGVVVAITDYKSVTEQNISSFINANPVALQEKKDKAKVPYNKDMPLFFSNNGGNGENTLFHSMLSSYTEGLGGGYSLREDSIAGTRITCGNLTITSIYRIALSDRGFFGNNRTIINVSDPSKLSSKVSGSAYLQWMSQNNAFCYEIKVPALLKEKIWGMMKKDLDFMFPQYDTHLEKHKQRCLVLTKTNDAGQILAHGGPSSSEFSPFGFKLQNFPLNRLIAQLNFSYLQASVNPIIDGTGINQNVNLEIQADLTDINSLNDQLEKYGLKFILMDKDIDMMVISDKKQAM
jgi:thiol-disulfide isomerase/thioredoxin